MDDNVEDAPIYRCEGKAPKPTRPHEDHGLAIADLPKWSESCQKPQSKSFAVPIHGSLEKIFQNPGDAGMYIISVARLRLDTLHGTTDWNVQNRSIHNNSWLMSLPFDVDNTGCHTPPFQRSDISSKHLNYYQDDYLVPHHYTSFTQMLSLYIYMPLTSFSQHVLTTNTLEFYRITSSQQPWMQQNTGQWHENMAFGMLPLNHSSFGQRTLIQSLWA